MIKIIKGDEERVIPAGAFKMFASAGWQKAENSEPHDDTDKNTKPTRQDSDLDENPEPETDIKEEEPILGADPEEEDVEYVDPEDLLKKPVGDLDFEELQIVAEYLGLDVENLTTVKKLRTAIKEAQR